MRYTDKMFIELKKRKANRDLGISGGQITLVKNFVLTSVNLSRRENHPRSGMDYKVTKLKDYFDLIELEFTRIDQL